MAAPSFVYLRIDGDLLSGIILDLVRVTQELNQHWTCEVECRRTEVDRPPFEQWLGKSFEAVTYDQLGAEHIVFAGFVVESSMDYKIHGHFGARLVAVADTYAMDSSPRNAVYDTPSLSTIAGELATRSGLSAAVSAPSKDSPKQYVQWGESDWNFLLRLADDHRAWLRPTTDGKLEVRNTFASGASIEFRGEYELLHFRATGRLAVPSYDGSHYDPRTMESRSYKAVSNAAAFSGASGPLVDAVKSQSAVQLLPGYGRQRARALTLQDYEDRLKLEAERAQGSSVTGYGVSRSQALRAGDSLTITGVIDAKGQYGLVKVVHEWTQQGYENHFWCTPWLNWRDPEAPKMRRWDGVVPARVVNHSDPENFGRYRIRFYWQEEGDPMLWARMLTPHAGADRGIFFQPEVGDEVMVGFEDGDVERPIIIGAVWNGVDNAPVQDFWGGEYDANDVKRIVTKSGHRVQLVDKPGKQAITLSTPNFLKISMLEQADETGRSAIHLSNTNGDIFLSAPNGRIHFHSQYFSRETGDITAAPAPPPPKKAVPPPPRSPAQIEALRKASVLGKPFCAVCSQN